MQADSLLRIDIFCDIATVPTPLQFQNGYATEPMWNDCECEFVARVSRKTCAISPVSVKCPVFASRIFSFTF
jgi:hypothetical protein